jgi:hypothetical protein
MKKLLLASVAAFTPPDAPVTPPGNGADTAPQFVDLDTIGERQKTSRKSAKAKTKVEPGAESEPTVKVVHEPSPGGDGDGRQPPRDPLFDVEEPEGKGPDPYDPESLRIDPISIDGLGDRVLTEGQIAIRKPHKREWFKLHPDPGFRMTVAAIVLKEEMNETYLIDPPLVQGLIREVNFYVLSTCINVGGNVFLWPVPAPTNDRRQNRWHTTAREAAKLALTKWVRMVADTDSGCYIMYQGADNLADVEYPKGKTLNDFIRLACGGEGIIRERDHPLLKRLSGQRA